MTATEVGVVKQPGEVTVLLEVVVVVVVVG